MAPRQPPRFVVRTHDAARERRMKLLLGAGWAASVAAAAALAWAFSAGPSGLARAPAGHATQLRAENDELRQQVANLQRAGQVADVATKELKRNLSERDEEISGLRTDLAFYARLVGGGGQRDGLKIQAARVSTVPGTPNAWNLVVTLTQNARRGDLVKGSVKVAVEGIEGDKVATLEGAALGQSDTSKGVPFAFKYFQQVQGSFTVPAGFKPTRLRVVAGADGGDSATSTVAWADAARTDEVANVQQQP
ncbi:DUF6776 family protein [Luteibacter yeojuensis]|uniref:Uncharacterized protein n=1 Tax=Luteibacter yeojuensis TaxID=345309 RepID=A0A0F3KYV1_9GAMM|nr:DUF6776 family protein [Luteibacter yeojuensis]KJV35294.1 hypothetical protein VI08_08350 [Luteibacter yeojuensis]